MCVICLMWEKEKLSKYEVSQALAEMIETEQIDPLHAVEVYDKLIEEVEEYEEDFVD